MAILADGIALDVDRGAAVGAVDGADALPELRELRRTEPPDEVLLAQELEEGDVVTVLGGAAQIDERRVALHVVRLDQRSAAAGTPRDLGR